MNRGIMEIIELVIINSINELSEPGLNEAINYLWQGKPPGWLIPILSIPHSADRGQIFH
jgi:hypothetical protein